jgi:type 1 glutamine amidotransferase
MRRRDMLLTTGAALGLSTFPLRWAGAADGKKPRVLYFTRSAGFQHGVVARKGDQLSFSEKVFTEMGEKNGFEVVCSKDGTLFDGEFEKFDALAFYTSGDLTKPGKRSPAMSAEGKQNLLDAVKGGMPLIGLHAATDTFRGKNVDPYIEMIGGEFAGHGAQQKATQRVASPKFPGAEKLGDGFEMHEEWYVNRKFNPDMHVILAQETEGMKGGQYERPPYPATWARMHGKGRVFYTSMGHREDVWTSDIFQQVLLGGLSWGLGHVDADVTSNFRQVTPDADTA